ncbi:hypothetical protein [Vulcanisaeta distributa]|uniref:hypothetical protein n=1 Tax=Vulcanisaeta distributa TaxID=164451 RepID=UPI0006D20F5F|nr:hypothetical protein [Vulcanisaeta distributa]
MKICFSRAGLIIIVLTIIASLGITIFAAARELLPPLVILIIIFLLIPIPAISIITLMTYPRKCRFLGDYVELSTHLCRERFKVVEVVDERHELRDYSVIVPFGFRAYPLINGWGGFGGNIPGGVFVFSTSDCDSRWRLMKLMDDGGKEFYAVICCGS